jgi:pyruvate formate lyase activating enzyme
MHKKFWGLGVLLIGLIITAIIIVKALLNNQKTGSSTGLHEAKFYQQLEEGKVACGLCPNRCVLAEGQRGLCKVRENIGGKLYSLVYGKPVTTNVDPVEKKPFYHFLPGSRVYSLATAGCNLECKFCQNWDISQRAPEDVKYVNMTPQDVVDAAIKSNSPVIAFTYNEPTGWYEYMFDIAKLAKEKGLRTVMVSSGYINHDPLVQLLPYLDAVRVDLKSFNSEVYRDLIRGNLEPVLDTIKTIHQSGVWLELIHLTVPGYTDDLNEIQKMCQWVKDNVGVDVPLHFTRFWPKFKLLNVPPTPEDTLKKARQTCLDLGLKYVYTGNIEDETGSATYCPDTGKAVISRLGYIIQANLVDENGLAPDCPSTISGVWK